MSEEEGKSRKKESQPTDKDKEKISAFDAIQTYIAAYIDSYMDYVEELNVKESDFPLFYTNYPFDVTGYILPDNSLCILFRGLAQAMTIDVKKEDFNTVDKEISEKKFHHICCYPPSHSYSSSQAKTEAKSDVESDIENAKLLIRDDVDGVAKAEILRTVRILSVTMPWVLKREVGKGALKAPSPDDVLKYETENLHIKEDEDFVSYSTRIRELESGLLGAPRSKPEEEIKEIPSPLSPPIPAPPHPSTNINIEIKQPETQTKDELFDEKTDLDILRLKKTLYIQTTDIEELRRTVKDLSNKLTNYEQMRQTVFRMNRRVFDADSRMGNVEKTNRDTMKKFAEMKAEQREENKKTRRFIVEKTKSARNQAMALGIGAIVFAVVVLIVVKWEEVRTFLGF
jgi:hypothetical protein